MRFVVYGPGAVGGTIGGRLAENGHEVALIARGAHLDALKKNGLTVADPERSVTMPLEAVGSPAELAWSGDEVVILGMKTQDTASALRELAAAAPPSVAVVCAQNGVENERLALRGFENVYGMCVMLPATHLEPGVVDAHSTPVAGILDLGRYPSGEDATAAAIAGALDSSGFSSKPQKAIMPWKYAKLLMNLGNALEAACGREARRSELYGRARDEGVSCYRAAAIDFRSAEEDQERRGDLLSLRPVEGRRRGGGSSWQSLARGTGSIEADYLNGEIVLLGRVHGVATPVNAVLQHIAADMARRNAEPGSLPVAEVEARVAALG